MTVYVDELRTSGSHVYCHMLADSLPELEKMARRLRVDVRKAPSRPHCDLDERKRRLALEKGAIEIGGMSGWDAGLRLATARAC